MCIRDSLYDIYRLLQNPYDEEVWYGLFGDRLWSELCIVIVRETKSPSEVYKRIEALAFSKRIRMVDWR